MAKRGPKSKFSPEVIEQILQMLREGAAEADIAFVLKVHRSTICRIWKKAGWK
jgi:hypothetical protein